MTGTPQIFGCIEAGGTKFVVGVGTRADGILDTARIATTTPSESLYATVKWLKLAATRYGALSAIGIATFGPAELDRSAANWGHITATPKPGWSDTDIAGIFAREFGVPIGFDTDVNGAALAEARWGASQGARISVYVTVGTGIGGGIISNGVPLHGFSHPEMGHFRPRRHADDFDFAGICPFHGDCLEGLASGPSIIARWGKPLSELPADHPGQAIIASYLAQLVVTLQSFLEPGKIVMGGGVMATPGLLDRVRTDATRLGAGYFRSDARECVVLPGLGDKSGLLGSLALAMDMAS
jgi:fructokinase